MDSRRMVDHNMKASELPLLVTPALISSNFSTDVGRTWFLIPSSYSMRFPKSARWSVRVIERFWLSCIHKRVFRLLKRSIRTLEGALSLEIIRRLCPRELELFNDRCMNAKVKFRFGGSSFPPMIYFKIYQCRVSGSSGVQYINGKKMIRHSSEASHNACALMGHRTFYNQLTVDALQNKTHNITDESDITTLKDYMKYTSVLDELPAHLGGCNNSWRHLTLEALPRHIVFYDVVDYLNNHKMSPRLRTQLPVLLRIPTNETTQLEQLLIMSHEPNSTSSAASTRDSVATSLHSHRSFTTLVRGRGSKQARQRASRMRHAYYLQVPDDSTFLDHSLSDEHFSSDHNRSATPANNNATFFSDTCEATNDKEAELLYEWTLSLDDTVLMTPRLQPSSSTMYSAGLRRE